MSEIASGLWIIIGVIVLIVVGKNWNRIFAPATSTITTTTSNESRCEYIDVNGNTVSITGSGAEFERLCREKKQSDRMYLNNVYYTPYRYYYGYNWYSYPWSGRWSNRVRVY